MPNDFQAAQGKDFADMEPVRSWEIRMAYSEYRNRKWEPKATAPSVISHLLKGPKSDPVETQISNFKFWVSYQERLSISVECSTFFGRGEFSATFLGIFQLRDQQLALVNEKDVPLSALRSANKATQGPKIIGTVETDFLKLHWNSADSSSPLTEIEYEEESTRRKISLHLGQDDALRTGTSYEWTIDFSSQVPGIASALFVEASDSAGIEQLVDLGRVHTFGVSKFSNRFSPLLAEAVSQTGQPFSINQFYSGLPESDYVDAFGQWSERFSPNTVHYHEAAEPFSQYNWELGVHLPCLVLERLVASQQFDLALKVVRQIYDPRNNSPVNACWSFPPFQEIANGPNDTIADPATAEMTMDEWQEDKANVHAAARANPRAYMTRIVMKYIEILVALGDDYFRRESLESIPLAIQMYVEASHIFGPQPITVPQLGKRSSITYDGIKGRLQGWNAEVEMELDFPFYVKPESRGTRPAWAVHLPRSRITTGYFCIPGNPALVALRDMIGDRLYKIRNGMDINGSKRSLPLFAPPIDPGALVNAVASGGMGVAGLLSDLESPMPQYRFQYLIGRASELVSEVRGFGSQFLSTKEAKDAERLSKLKTQHQTTMVSLTMRVMEHQKTEIEKSIEVLQVTRQQEEMRLRYHLALTGDEMEVPQIGEKWKDIEQNIERPTKDDYRMTKYEAEQDTLSIFAQGILVSAGAMKGIAALTAPVPQVGAKANPMGVGADVTVGGDQLSKGLSYGADVLKFTKEQLDMQVERAERKGNAILQLQERRLEINTSGRTLMQIDKEVEQLEASLVTSDAYLKAQQQEIENAAAEEEWMRTKYTSEQFYALMESTISTMLRQSFSMAVDLIKSVKRVMDFELGIRQSSQSNNVSISGFWETCRDGLLSGDALAMELQRLQSVFESTKRWDFNVGRIVSLRQIDPHAFLELRETGNASFQLKESLFDQDYPGHYCRHFLSLSVLISSTLEPSPPVSCTLLLTKHKYRTSATATSYAEQADEDFRTDKVPIQSIAVTYSSWDNGIIDSNYLMHERYHPFEGAGVISDWQITLPDNFRQFDYSTIDDVQLNVKYSSIAGGDASAALDAAAKDMKENGHVASIDLINDLRSESESDSYMTVASGEIEISEIAKRLPYMISRGNAKFTRVEIFLKSKTNDLDQTTVKATLTIGNGPGTLHQLSEVDTVRDLLVFRTSSDDKTEITLDDPWKIKIQNKEDDSEWVGELMEAWLLISYSLDVTI
ncbi:hypothetical protein N7456_009826 [Penicillium angulare]|uniref:Tc toxin complex TcA C-terminal TcB-binding domain-containing protein n=1 Tax=Penicillium angulare TaxID=116970 RepID=A0A9W9F5D7_9EURO|nr:hypothetical protein N7456_009826 [Penicillium angulare]